MMSEDAPHLAAKGPEPVNEGAAKIEKEISVNNISYYSLYYLFLVVSQILVLSYKEPPNIRLPRIIKTVKMYMMPQGFC